MSDNAIELALLPPCHSYSLDTEADSDVPDLSVVSLTNETDTPTNTPTNTNASDANTPKHPPTEITLKNDSDRDVTIMASQTTDALNRTFADLKSKSEDVRLRASYDLYRLVATASRGMSRSSLH